MTDSLTPEQIEQARGTATHVLQVYSEGWTPNRDAAAQLARAVLTLAEQQPEPLREWRCLACGATTRARMSDQD